MCTRRLAAVMATQIAIRLVAGSKRQPAIREKQTSMRSFTLAALGILFAVSACARAPQCTAASLGRKAQEVNVALQEAIANDPARALEFSIKAQEVALKYQGSPTYDDACRAYDELLGVLKG